MNKAREFIMLNLILIVIIVAALFSLWTSLEASETQTKTRALETSEHLTQQNRKKIFQLEQQMVEVSKDPTKAGKLLHLRNQILLLRAENRKIRTLKK